MSFMGFYLFESLKVFIVDIIIFLILFTCINKVYNLIKDNKHFNLKNYMPEDEVHSLRQVFYLILMTACFIDLIYSLICSETQLISFSVFDLILSMYFCISIDKSTWKNKILAFSLIPFGSISFLLYGEVILTVLHIIHIPAFIYLIKRVYDQFTEYTQSNGLGLTIVLLFAIIFISLFVTSMAEGVNLLDSLLMASNAFTSNGYTVSGHTVLSKLDSLLLAWSGYVLSGVGTATLTAGILIRHFNKRFDRLEKIIDENKKE